MENKFLTEKVARKILKKALGSKEFGVMINNSEVGDALIAFFYENKKEANRLLWALKILANKKCVKDEKLLKV